MKVDSLERREETNVDIGTHTVWGVSDSPPNDLFRRYSLSQPLEIIEFVIQKMLKKYI